MKKLIFLLSLTAIIFSTSCNSFMSKSEPAEMKFTTHREALDTLKKKYIASIDSSILSAKKEETEKILGPGISLLSTDSAKQFLMQLKWGDLLNSKREAEQDYASIYNGFFGADRYRIEFYLSDVKSDSLNPFSVSLQGKTRFKKNIQPFSGNITIDSILEFRDPNVMKYYTEYAQGKVKSYHLAGNYKLSEDSQKWGTGVYAGRFYMDVKFDDAGEQDYWYYYNDEYESGDTIIENNDSAIINYKDMTAETRGAGFLFDGNWTSYKNNTVKPLLMAHDVFMFGNDILTHFSYGEREIEIDPKYKALGWDNYWENDEWYNESGDNAKVMMISW